MMMNASLCVFVTLKIACYSLQLSTKDVIELLQNLEKKKMLMNAYMCVFNTLRFAVTGSIKGPKML